jgi:hypothetical protein
MPRVNLVDRGLVVYDSAKTAAAIRADGLINRDLLRQLDAEGKNKWDVPELFWIAHDEPPPTGGPPFPWFHGPWIWLTHDTEILGEDWDHTGFLYDFDVAANVAGTVASCFRYQTPFSLRAEKIFAECKRPTLTQAQGGTAFTHTPGKGGNAPDPHVLELSRVKLRGGRFPVLADSGPTNSANDFTIDMDRCDVIGEIHALSCHNDVANGGGKSVHVSRSRLGTEARVIHPAMGSLPAFGSSHVMYIAATVNVRTKDLRLHGWLTAKYGKHHWGAGLPGQRPRYVTHENLVCEPSGQGYAMITSPLANTKISNMVMECRTGIQCRGDVSIDGIQIRHKPQLAGTISSIAGLDASSIRVNDVDVDLSYLAGQPCTVFDQQTAAARFTIGRVDITGRAPAGVNIFGSAVAAGEPAEMVADDVQAKAYHVPDADYAAGVRSELCVVNMAQGNLRLTNSNFEGDMSHDRGGLKMLHPGFGRATFENVKVKPLRGLAIYATQSDQMIGSLLVDGPISLAADVFQRLQLPDAKGPATTVPFAATLALKTSACRYKVAGPGALARMLVNGQEDDTRAYVGTEADVEFLDAVSISAPPWSALPVPPPVGSFEVDDHAVRPLTTKFRFKLTERLVWVQIGAGQAV